MADREDTKPILMGHSYATDPRVAVAELKKAVMKPDTRLVLFFCSSDYDLDLLEKEIERLFAGIEVVGCTTAGEIGPAGFCEHSLVGVSFSENAASAVAGRIDGLRSLTIAQGQAFIENLIGQFEDQMQGTSPDNSFAFLMVDGLALQEETVAHVVQSGLGDIPLIGGSAGDGMRFSSTCVYHNGRFHTDSAVLLLIKTPLPFKVFKTQHFIPGEERLVATEVDTEKRIVMEINGRPAALEYARATGFNECHLSPTCFAASPVVVLMDGTNYVRSIQKVNDDNSLTFYCAIDEGLVFRVARGENLVTNMIQTLEDLQRTLGSLQLVLVCDCILRKLEILRKGKQERAEDIMRRYHLVGFNTYGEQFRGIHVNQTLTGIAFGTAARGTDV